MQAGATTQGVVNTTLLGLERPYHSVDLYWAPLAYSKLMDSMIARAGRMYPEIAVLNTGSNDLCRMLNGEVPEYGPKSPRALGEMIFQMAVKLQVDYNVKVVMIMSCIRRAAGFVGPEDRFQWFMDRFNDYLANRCEYVRGIHFYYMTGYCEQAGGGSSQVSQFTKDDVHPYMHKYRGKLRAALARASRLYLEGR